MSPSSEQVLREVLTISYRASARGIVNGLLFAGLSVAGMWPHLPHGLLVAWATIFALIALARLQIARLFLAAQPQGAAELRRWVRRGALGYAAVGFAWGFLGCAALHFAPGEPLYLLWVWFLIAFFSVLAAQRAGAHPLVFNSFVFASMLPIIALSLAEPGPYYPLGILAELLIIVMALLVGRSGNSYVQESVRMRFENLELLKDLTRQKDELDRVNAAKTRFLAAASHDLRQPMQAIALLAESLDQRVRDEGTRKIVESMRVSVGAMSSLLNGILDISKLDAGTVKPQRTVFPISRLLDRLHTAFTERAALKGLTLRVRPSAEFVETDEILLARILTNLMDNALRYTERGGILLACRPRGDSVSLEVWDTGIGIPADKTDEIFLEFHQLANPQRDREQGLGIGLAIVERTARLLYLPLQVRSRPGKGSVFTLEIPRGDPARARAPETPAIASLDGCGVLVVEDDRDIRDAMTSLLEDWNCRVAAIASGAETDAALERLGGAPDIVIADYDLAGENGIQVIDRIRRRHARVEGVLVSGDVSGEALRQADLAGYPMLHKPVRPARLRAMIAAARRDGAEASV